MHTTCQVCSKRPATIHLTEVAVAGGVSELHLCAQCVRDNGWSLETSPPPIADILAKGAASEPATTAAPADPNPGEGAQRCPSCGLAFADYSASNLFGCAECYATFTTRIDGLLRRYHGSVRHTGRGPGRTPGPANGERAQRRVRLEQELNDAVSAERYEQAAALRDELRRIQDEIVGTAGASSDDGGSRR